MAALSRIVTAPVRLGGHLTRADVAVLVAADTVVRRFAALGRPLSWWAPTLWDDAAAQAAARRRLAGTGGGRTAQTAADESPAPEQEAATRAALADALRTIGVEADLSGVDAHEAVQAARTAFVQLYDAGVIERRWEVLDTCPRCATVVDRAEADPGAFSCEVLAVDMASADEGEGMTVEVVAVEMLPGAVAVAVPEGDPRAGTTVTVPLADRPVPVVPWPAATAPRVVVPAHDREGHVIARQVGLAPRWVFDREGIAVDGPFAGLARFAARARAVESLVAAGAVSRRHEGVETVDVCRHCGGILLPLLGEHWFLAAGALQRSAADAVREGAVRFVPARARDEFLAAADQGRDLCLSLQARAGVPVPAARCRDCGRVTVTVAEAESCGTCMGVLEPDGEVLDAGFVASAALLGAAGWPADESGPAREAADTALLVAPAGVGRWAVPMAALGLRLAGAVPFGLVAVQDVADPNELADFDSLAVCGVGPARLAALAGHFDLQAVAAVAAGLAEPPEGGIDLDALVEACDDALAQAAPQAALALLADAAAEGVPAAAGDRLRALAAPFLGGMG